MLEDTVIKLFALIDSIVELYLKTVIKPLLTFHEKFYSALNKTMRKALDDNRSQIPEWFTANWITYARTVLVVPTILLLAWGHTFLPSFLVIFVDFGDFLDGVVARFWVDVRKEMAEKLSEKEKAPTPTNSDDESYGKFCNATGIIISNDFENFFRSTGMVWSNFCRRVSPISTHLFPHMTIFSNCEIKPNETTNYRGHHDWIATKILFLAGASPQQYVWGLCRRRL